LKAKLTKVLQSIKIFPNELAESSKIRILLSSGLASIGILGITVWYLNNSQPTVDSSRNKSKIENIPKSSSSSMRNSEPSVIFPQPQLPISFQNLPTPSLVINTSNTTHRSTIEIDTLINSPRLQKILDNTIESITGGKFRKEDLSATIIDVNRSEVAGYQSDHMEYPASIVKLFWAVVLYEQIDRKSWKNTITFDALAEKMLVESDNEAASFILDFITNAPSLSQNLAGKNWSIWRSNRLSINHFFSQSNYKNLNISQKTYPIPYLNLSEPMGTDKQLRLENTTSDRPTRNKVSSDQAAKIMYESCYVPSLSQESARKICSWLTRNLKDESWRKASGVPINDFNPIKGFMGEGVAQYKDVTIRSKAGWTKDSRQEVIAIKDKTKVLIISVFANNASYANDAKVFPTIAKRLYAEMDRP
jgi:beta-lactamase class A